MNAASSVPVQELQGNSQYQTDTSSTASPPVPTITVRNPNSSRQWRDVFWLIVFIFHLIVFGSCLGLLGANRFHKADRLNIDRFTNITVGSLSATATPPPPPPVATEDPSRLTETFWPFYAAAAGAGLLVAWAWLALLGMHAGQMMRVSVHGLTTYLAVVSVFCFWAKHFFWGVAFAVGAALQFLYIMSVLERFPFTMLVLNKSVKMVWSYKQVIYIGYLFTLLMLFWMVLWSFGVAGIVALSIDNNGRWWLLLVFSVSLFWTGAVLCNTVHVIVSAIVVHLFMHGDLTMPPKLLMTSLRYALTTSFGSICYGSLFTAAIRTLRWEVVKVCRRDGIRGFGGIVFAVVVQVFMHGDLTMPAEEPLITSLLYVLTTSFGSSRYGSLFTAVIRSLCWEIGVYGKSFNRSARDAWELFQSTGVEALIAYDCSGAVLLMSVVLGGLITGTCTSIWVWFKRDDKVIMVGTTAMLMGMILMGLVVVVVESAVTSIYVCYAEDPNLIRNWDPEFYNQLSETLHQRLQYRSAIARQILDNRLPNTNPV